MEVETLFCGEDSIPELKSGEERVVEERAELFSSALAKGAKR